MALAKVLWSLREDLQYYTSSRGQPGFVQKLVEAISELKGAGLTPQALGGWLAAQADNNSKLQDLALLYAAYEDSMAGQLADREDRDAEMLHRLAGSALFAGQDVLVYGFDLLTPPLIRLLCALAGQAGSLMLTMVIDKQADPDGSAFAPVSASLTHLTRELDALGLPWAWESIADTQSAGPAALGHLRRNLLRLRQAAFPDVRRQDPA